MIDAKPWIENLNNPLVLVGFGLFVFATLITVLIKKRKNISAIARSFIGMTFVLALITVLGGLWIAVNKSGLKQPEQQPSNIQQQTVGSQSPAVNSGKDVNIQYGVRP